MRRPRWRKVQRFTWIAVAATAMAWSFGWRTNAAPASDEHAAPASDEHAAADIYLRHIYSVFFGVRACAELSMELKDHAYETSIPLDEARAAMHSVERAAAEAGFSTDAMWASTAPRALVTASALKRSPQRLALCRKMGDVFKEDEANLQNLLGHLGARQAIIPKGF